MTGSGFSIGLKGRSSRQFAEGVDEPVEHIPSDPAWVPLVQLGGSTKHKTAFIAPAVLPVFTDIVPITAISFDADDPRQRLGAYMVERWKIYLRREAGEPEPWTTNKILANRNNRFCNIRRCDDAVSRWVTAHIIEPFCNHPDLWFLAVAMRCGFNEPEAVAKILQYLLQYDPSRCREILEASHARGEPIMRTKAYRLPTPSEKGASGIAFVLDEVLAPIWQDREALRPRPGETCSVFGARLEQCFQISGFRAAQVVADVKPVLFATAADRDTYARPGPGSKPGLNLVRGRDAKASWTDAAWYHELIRLKAELTPVLAERGLPDLDLQDWQNNLCEFYKFEGYRSGTRKSGKQPKPEKAKPPLEPEQGAPPENTPLVSDHEADPNTPPSHILDDLTLQDGAKPQPCLQAALAYAARGWAVFPVPRGTKKSHKSAEFSDGRNWGATRDASEIRRDYARWPLANVGIPTGAANGIWVLEADTKEGGHQHDGIAALQALIDQHGALPDTLQARSPSGSLHYYFTWPTDKAISNSASAIAPGIDVRGEGGMVVAPPSVKDGVGVYAWSNDTAIAEAPAWLVELAIAASSGAPNSKGERAPNPDLEAALPLVKAAVAAIANADLDWESWNNCGMAIFGATGGSNEGFALFDAFSKKSKAKYNALKTFDKWRLFHTSPPQQIGFGSLHHWASETDPNWLNNAAEEYDADAVADGSAKAETHAGTNGSNGGDTDAGKYSPVPWPELADAALHGLAGEVVATILPHTEADPVALLLQYLASFGNVIGRGRYYRVEETQHFGNIFAVLVGDTSKARKGTSADRIRPIMTAADPVWSADCVKAGMSTGEGVIAHVRDEVYAMRKGVRELIDLGVADKRLLLQEHEFFQVLAVMKREGNTLSRVIRDAWDSRARLETLTKHSPTKATGACISIVAHITIEELRAKLDETAMANGFANRFLFACVKRSKLLPFGRPLDPEPVLRLGKQTRDAAAAAQGIDAAIMSERARALWGEVYPELTRGGDGMLAHITSRAEAQTIRLALLYALLDRAVMIDAAHLEAALAVWRYCEASTRFIFGELLGDAVVDTILQSLRRRKPNGMAKSEIFDLFGRNLRAANINVALSLLERAGKARCEQQTSVLGRSREMWFAI